MPQDPGAIPSWTTTRAVAGRLGIADVLGEVRRAGKVALVERLQAEGRRVAMAGDGTNDALVKGDPRSMAGVRIVSEQTGTNMRQNLGFALNGNRWGVPIAAGVPYPVFGCLSSPLIAAPAMRLGSVSVVGNALRLQRGCD